MVWRKKSLTALQVKQLTEQGRYHDGDGLYLEIKKSRSRSWIYRFRLNGRSREMGLGSARFISLADAREAALEGKRLVIRGIDPIDARKAERAAKRTERGNAVTFD